MEEVLRKLYQQHPSHIQRIRIDRALNQEQYFSLARKKYDFREELSLKTPETSFSLDDEIRFEK